MGVTYSGHHWAVKAIMLGKLATVVKATGQGTFVVLNKRDGSRSFTWTHEILCTHAAEVALPLRVPPWTPI